MSIKILICIQMSSRTHSYSHAPIQRNLHKTSVSEFKLTRIENDFHACMNK